MKVVGVEPEPTPIVLVRELGTTTVNIEVRFWVNSQRLPFIEMTSLAAQAIKESLQQAEIKVAAIPQIKVIQLTNNSNYPDNSDNHEANIKQSNQIRLCLKESTFQASSIILEVLVWLPLINSLAIAIYSPLFRSANSNISLKRGDLKLALVTR